MVFEMSTINHYIKNSESLKKKNQSREHLDSISQKSFMIEFVLIF